MLSSTQVRPGCLGDGLQAVLETLEAGERIGQGGDLDPGGFERGEGGAEVQRVVLAGQRQRGGAEPAAGHAARTPSAEASQPSGEP